MNAELPWTSIDDFLQFSFSEMKLEQPVQKVFEKYYGSYLRSFSPRMRHFYALQAKEVVDCIKKKQGLRLLEVGCGTGTESLWFSMLGANVLAIDIKADRLGVARSRLKFVEAKLNRRLDCEFRALSLLQLDEEAAYDIIWMEQSFHHLEPRDEIIRKVFRLLRPGGKLIISEANALNPILQTQLFLRRGWKTLAHYIDEKGNKHLYGNERVLSARCLKSKLLRAGFETETVRYFRMFPNRKTFDSLLEWEKKDFHRLPWIYSHYNLVAVKPAISGANELGSSRRKSPRIS